MKKLWTAALTLAMVLALTGCGTQKPSGSGPAADYAPDEGYTLGAGDVVQLNGFRSIDIEWVSGSVSVELYDGEGIELREALSDGGAVTQRMEWRVTEDQSTLDIRSQPRQTGVTEEKHLTVKLPRSLVLYELDIETVSAAVSVDLTEEDTLTLSELDVTSVSGTVSVNAANAGEISLSTTSGDIRGSVRTQKLEADSVSGSIDLALDIMPAEVEMETTGGSITLGLREAIVPPSPLPVAFKTTSGTFSCAPAYTPAKDAAWEFDTVSGDVAINVVK